MWSTFATDCSFATITIDATVDISLVELFNMDVAIALLTS